MFLPLVILYIFVVAAFSRNILVGDYIRECTLNHREDFGNIRNNPFIYAIYIS